jgi:pilus assembly protein TadC
MQVRTRQERTVAFNRFVKRTGIEEAVGKAGIKMLFPIVLFILPVLFVITLAPGMLSVLKDLKTLGGGR